MNFHYDDSFNHIMSGEAANHCLLKNTRILHAENEACVVAFLSLCNYIEKKNCHFFLFWKLCNLKGKDIWTLPAPSPPLKTALAFAIQCVGLQREEGVFATFLVSLPFLRCHGNRTVASALCPTPAAAWPDAELT